MKYGIILQLSLSITQKHLFSFISLLFTPQFKLAENANSILYCIYYFPFVAAFTYLKIVVLPEKVPKCNNKYQVGGRD
jgi:hypothetical protein